MIHQHNPSTLLTGHRLAVYYPPTGTGRDTYIMTDNGGTNAVYHPQGVPHLGNYMKFGAIGRKYKPRSSTRFQKYISDGTGRDRYVVYCWHYLVHIMEVSTLRISNVDYSCSNSDKR
jgi:hypothetical protein